MTNKQNEGRITYLRLYEKNASRIALIEFPRSQNSIFSEGIMVEIYIMILVSKGTISCNEGCNIWSLLYQQTFSVKRL